MQIAIKIHKKNKIAVVVDRKRELNHQWGDLGLGKQRGRGNGGSFLRIIWKTNEGMWVLGTAELPAVCQQRWVKIDSWEKGSRVII